MGGTMKKKQKVKRRVDRELPLKLMILGNKIEQYLKNNQLKEEDIPGLLSHEFDILLMRVMMSELKELYEKGVLTREEYLSEYDGFQTTIMTIQLHNAIFSRMVLDKLSPVETVKQDQKLVLKFINTAKQVITDLGVHREDIVLEIIERMSSEVEEKKCSEA